MLTIYQRAKFYKIQEENFRSSIEVFIKTEAQCTLCVALTVCVCVSNFNIPGPVTTSFFQDFVVKMSLNVSHTPDGRGGVLLYNGEVLVPEPQHKCRLLNY